MSTEIQHSGIVVVGAGPAGIVSALELAGHGVQVLLLESGTDRYQDEIQQLSDLADWDPHRHAAMSIASRRQFGGASVIWGGRCVPFDSIDFQPRSYVPYSTWPISFRDAEDYYSAAADYCRCGQAVFSTRATPAFEKKTIVPYLQDGDVLTSELERWSLPTDFGREYRSAITTHTHIRRMIGFTATGIRVQASDGQVTGIEGVNQEGQSVLICGTSYVLACGGLETTRLLMQPSEQFPQGLGNSGGWLGRCYMGHISGQIAKVHFTGDPKQTNYGFLKDTDGVYVRQRFTLSEAVQIDQGINNFAAWLVNPKIGDPSHGNGVLSFAYLALSSRFGERFAPEAIRQSAIADATDGCWLRHLRNMLKDLPRTAWFIPTFGYKRFLRKRKVPGFFQFSEVNRYPLHYHAEQIPQLESRVKLSHRRDRLGVRMLDVDLRFADQDVESVVRAHQVIDGDLRRQGAGRLEYLTQDLAESVWEQASDGYHQAGTTRMASGPELGVVDENCRVYGTKNLYVASSSVFVTSGQANSTFLIVALAIRLAEHLAAQKRHTDAQ